jgi:hypothetical protein
MPLARKIHLFRLLQQVSEVKPLNHWKETVRGWRAASSEDSAKEDKEDLYEDRRP